MFTTHGQRHHLQPCLSVTTLICSLDFISSFRSLPFLPFFPFPFCFFLDTPLLLLPLHFLPLFILYFFSFIHCFHSFFTSCFFLYPFLSLCLPYLPLFYYLFTVSLSLPILVSFFSILFPVRFFLYLSFHTTFLPFIPSFQSLHLFTHCFLFLSLLHHLMSHII